MKKDPIVILRHAHYEWASQEVLSTLWKLQVESIANILKDTFPLGPFLIFHSGMPQALLTAQEMNTHLTNTMQIEEKLFLSPLYGKITDRGILQCLQTDGVHIFISHASEILNYLGRERFTFDTITNCFGCLKDVEYSEAEGVENAVINDKSMVIIKPNLINLMLDTMEQRIQGNTQVSPKIQQLLEVWNLSKEFANWIREIIHLFANSKHEEASKLYSMLQQWRTT